MLYSDNDILEAMDDDEISISPYDRSRLQAASYDLTLSGDYVKMSGSSFDIDDGGLTSRMTVNIDTYDLAPGEFILSSTVERIRLSDKVGARFEGKSSLGRIGLATHITAGFIDPGFEGNITVELKNESSWNIKLRKNMAIGQICFYELKTLSREPYGTTSKSHYQHQNGVCKSWQI